MSMLHFAPVDLLQILDVTRAAEQRYRRGYESAESAHQRALVLGRKVAQHRAVADLAKDDWQAVACRMRRLEHRILRDMAAVLSRTIWNADAQTRSQVQTFMDLFPAGRWVVTSSLPDAAGISFALGTVEYPVATTQGGGALDSALALAQAVGAAP